MKQQVLDCFAKLFGGEGDIRTYFAPGRVNLIGEHTDYNGGHVFPCALTIGTSFVISSGPSLVSRASASYSSMWMEV